MKSKLLERGYKTAVVDAGIQRARDVLRSEAFEKVERVVEENGRQHRLIVEL